MVHTTPDASVDPGPNGMNRGMRVVRFAGIAAVLLLGAVFVYANPAREPRYVVYRSELQLPQIAVAIARAGERESHSPWSFLRPKKPGTPNERAA